jgi:hypothetical protein
MIIVFNSTKEWTTLFSWDFASFSFVRGKSLSMNLPLYLKRNSFKIFHRRLDDDNKL